MNTLLRTTTLSIIILALGTQGGSPGYAQTTLPDLAGDWVLSNLYLPNQLQPDPIDPFFVLPLQGLPPDAQSGPYPPAIGFEQIRLSVDSDGFYVGFVEATSDTEDQGEVFGDLAITEAGFVRVFEEEGAALFAVNAGRNIIFSMDPFEDYTPDGRIVRTIDVDFVLRVPETLAPADLEGVWVGGDQFLTGVFPSFGVDLFTVTMAGDGSGTVVTPEYGEEQVTAETDTEGRVTFSTPEGEAHTFLINAAKDVLLQIDREANEYFMPEFVPMQWGTIEVEYEYFMAVAVKKPESLTLQDMVGVWNLYILTQDAQWFTSPPFEGGGGEDFEPYGNFMGADTEQVRVVVKAPRTETSTAAPLEATIVSGELDNEGAAGAKVYGEMKIVDGQPYVTVNVDGQAESIAFAINASKDFMIAHDIGPVPAENGGTRMFDFLVGLKKYDGDLGLLEKTGGAAPRTWLRIPWFGNVFVLSASGGWAFHEEHGWVFLSGKNVADGFWVFFPGLRPEGSPQGVALWTSEALYPNFLRVNPERVSGPLAGFSFVNYARRHFERTGELWFYDFYGAEWVQSFAFTGIQEEDPAE